MPETIATLTADALCDLLDITNFEKRREAALARAREMREQAANQDTNNMSGVTLLLIIAMIIVFFVVIAVVLTHIY